MRSRSCYPYLSFSLFGCWGSCTSGPRRSLQMRNEGQQKVLEKYAVGIGLRNFHYWGTLWVCSGHSVANLVIQTPFLRGWWEVQAGHQNRRGAQDRRDEAARVGRRNHAILNFGLKRIHTVIGFVERTHVTPSVQGGVVKLPLRHHHSYEVNMHRSAKSIVVCFTRVLLKSMPFALMGPRERVGITTMKTVKLTGLCGSHEQLSCTGLRARLWNDISVHGSLNDISIHRLWNSTGTGILVRSI